MPLMTRPDGEGVYIAPSRHRPAKHRRTSTLPKAATYAIWWDYHRKGISIADIASMVGLNPDHVRRCIARGQRFLEERGYVTRSNYVPALIPLFGCGEFVPATQRKTSELCERCQNGARLKGSLVCMHCHRAVEHLDERLARQWVEDEQAKARKAEQAPMRKAGARCV